MNSKLIYTIIATVGAGIEEGTRCALRYYGQKKLQQRVNKEMPDTTSKDLSVTSDNIQFTIHTDNSIDLENCQEISMDEVEEKEWKSLISRLGGETTKAGLNVMAMNGLLECDVPIRDLCRIKNNPDAMRGLIINDGKISKHATLHEAGLGNVAPLLVFQCMSIVTSQYYLQIITDTLNTIDTKLDIIIKCLEADDKAKLKVAYSRFKELGRKTTYDREDKLIVSEFSNCVDILREKYKEMLKPIDGFTVKYAWSDKKEAMQKIKALNGSKYFHYLDMAMQSEMLSFMAVAVSVKVAKYLGNEEDVKIYINRLNLDYWNNYVDQFNKIKHDVIRYLELEAEASWMQTEDIVEMKNNQLKIFNDVEESMLNLQRQLNYRSIQYVKIMEDGSLKKYISFDNKND